MTLPLFKLNILIALLQFILNVLYNRKNPANNQVLIPSVVFFEWSIILIIFGHLAVYHTPTCKQNKCNKTQGQKYVGHKHSSLTLRILFELPVIDYKTPLCSCKISVRFDLHSISFWQPMPFEKDPETMTRSPIKSKMYA